MTVADKERAERFDALFREFLPDMAAYCSWRAHSSADAEDAVSEIFLIVWRRLDEVPSGREARLWLYGTARRVLANQARAIRRRDRLSARVAEGKDQGDPRVEGSFAQGEGPFAGAVKERSGDLAERVHLALGRLSPADREILLLAEWEGLAPAEMARVLRCPTVTARGRLFRARRRFRQAYETAPEERCASPVDSSESASRPTEGVVPCA